MRDKQAHRIAMETQIHHLDAEIEALAAAAGQAETERQKAAYYDQIKTLTAKRQAIVEAWLASTGKTRGAWQRVQASVAAAWNGLKRAVRTLGWRLP